MDGPGPLMDGPGPLMVSLSNHERLGVNPLTA